MTQKELQELKKLLADFGKKQEEKFSKLEVRISQLGEVVEKEIKPAVSDKDSFPPNLQPQTKIINQGQLKIEIMGDASLTPEQKQEFLIRLRALMKEWKIFSVNMVFEKPL